MKQYTPYNDVNTVLDMLLTDAKQVLGKQFVGIYLYGSLASGGFDPKTSDIDFVIVTADVLPEETIAALSVMHKQIWASKLKWIVKLEGSYVPKTLIRRHDPNGPACPTINEGRFYVDKRGSDWIIQRHVVREVGIILEGPDPKTLIDPVSSDDIRLAVHGILNEWWFPMLDHPEWLEERGSEYHAYAVLSMCRSLHALEFGTIVSKLVAAKWAQEKFGDKWSQVIEQALEQRGDKGQCDLYQASLGFVQFTKDMTSTLS